MSTRSPTDNRFRWGYVFVVAAAILWGISGSSAKYLFNRGTTPFQLVQLRLTIAAGSLLIWLLLKRPHRLKIARQDILYFALFGMVGMAACQFTYLYAISKIHVAAAILLQYLAPCFIVLHSALFARERVAPPVLLALLLATMGCYLVVGAYNLDLLTMNLSGVISGLLSAVTFAWYSVHGEHGMRRYNPWTVLFYALFFAALVWNIVLPPMDGFRRIHGWVDWTLVFYIGLMGTLLPFGLYLEGVSLIRSTRASITATLEPITAGVVAYLFLGEVMELWQMLGGALVIVSIVLLQLRQNFDEKAPSVIREGA